MHTAFEKVTSDGLFKDKKLLVLGTQSLLILLIGITAIRERNCEPACQNVEFWLTACLFKFSSMVAVQFVIAYRETIPFHMRSTKTDFYLSLAVNILTGVMGIIGILGIGVATNSPKCSRDNPILWWSAFLVAIFILFFMILKFFFAFSQANNAQDLKVLDGSSIYDTQWIDEDMDYNGSEIQDFSESHAPFLNA